MRVRLNRADTNSLQLLPSEVTLISIHKYHTIVMKGSDPYAEINQAFSRLEEIEAEQSELEEEKQELENEIDRLTSDIPKAEEQYHKEKKKKKKKKKKKWVERLDRWRSQCREKKERLELVVERISEIESEKYEPFKRLNPKAKETLKELI